MRRTLTVPPPDTSVIQGMTFWNYFIFLEFNSPAVSGAGVVTLLHGEVTNRAISRDGNDKLFTGWYVKYQIYTFEIWPDPLLCNDFTEEISFTEDADIVRNIVLGQPGMLCGQVCIGDTGKAVPGAVVTAYSASQKWWNGTLADENGIWYFENVPDAPDYMVIVRADGYGTQVRTGISPRETRSASVPSLFFP